MSNEELVVLIQNGEHDYIGQLWEQVNGLVKWKAGHIIAPYECIHGIEFDDLINTGFLAMVAAVAGYSPDKGTFSNWFIYYLQTKFAEVTGYRTVKGQREPLNNALSFSYAVGEDSDTDFGEFQPDPVAAADMDAVEEAEFQNQLHVALEVELLRLPAEFREILRLHYYDGLNLRDIAKLQGVSKSRIGQVKLKALEELRKPKHLHNLLPFYRFDFYHGAGLQSFKYSGMSIQEKYLIQEEEYEAYMEEQRQIEQQRQEEKQLEAEKQHNHAMFALIEEIQAKQKVHDVSNRQLWLSTGMSPKTLNRRLENPDGITLLELWKIIGVLHLDPVVVLSAVGCTQ